MILLTRAVKLLQMVAVFVFVAVLLIVVGPFDALMGVLGLKKRRRKRD